MSETGLWWCLTPDDRAATDDLVLGKVVDGDPEARIQERARLAAELTDAIRALPGPEPEVRDAADAVRIIEAARRRSPQWWRPQQDQWRDVPAARPTDEVRVLATGIDTLVLSFEVELRPEIFGRLAELRTLAEQAADLDGERKAKPGAVWVARYGLQWEMLPHGARPHWRYILRGPACTIRVRRRNPENRIPVEVEFRQVWLWRDGYDTCVETIREMLRAWSVDPEVRPRALVTRIDLAVDWQGWGPTGRELLEGEIVTRAHKRGMFCRAQRIKGKGAREERRRQREEGALGDRIWYGEKDAQHRVDSAWWRGRTFTGYQFGTGEQVGRVYLKSFEIQQTGKLWFRGLWAGTPGYDPDAPVWRCEFQLRSPALRSLVSALDAPVDAEPGRDPLPAGLLRIGAQWDHVRAVLDGLWARLTGRDGPGGWLQFRVRQGDTNVTRWPTLPAWNAIARTPWPAHRRSRVRRIPKTVRIDESKIEALERGRQARPADRQVGLDHWLADPDRGRWWGPDGRVDLDAVARHLGGPRTLELFGDGPRHSRDEHPAVELENARDRADRLKPWLLGGIARYVAELDIAAGRDLPVDARDAWTRMVEALKRDAHKEITQLHVHVAQARARAAIASAARFDVARCQGVYRPPARASA